MIVIDDAFDWQGDVPPEIPPEELIIYEVHVKGFTAHPSSGVARPGTYAGFMKRYRISRTWVSMQWSYCRPRNIMWRIFCWRRG